MEWFWQYNLLIAMIIMGGWGYWIIRREEKARRNAPEKGISKAMLQLASGIEQVIKDAVPLPKVIRRPAEEEKELQR